MSSVEFIKKVLWTAFNKAGRRHWRDTENEFFNATRKKLSDYFDFKENDLRKFLEGEPVLFNVDSQGMVTAKPFNEKDLYRGES